MDVILAADLKNGSIVHGKSGMRETYFPIRTPLTPASDPVSFVRDISPKYLYLADLDRISGNGDHDTVIPELVPLTREIYLDRGSSGPGDILPGQGITPVYGTETAGPDFTRYQGGYLSVDIRDGCVIPTGEDPVHFLSRADRFSFDGCIILNITGVGTKEGLDQDLLAACREAYHGRLLWGGGVGTSSDLDLLAETHFDGTIIATAVHSGMIPVDVLRRGSWC